MNISIRNSNSLLSFKNELIKSYNIEKPSFNHDASRHNQVAFMQLRLGFSTLNDHLYQKGCVDSSICSCGLQPEDIDHYFMSCLNFRHQRHKLFSNISNINQNIQPNVALILYSSTNLSKEDNDMIVNVISLVMQHMCS